MTQHFVTGEPKPTENGAFPRPPDQEEFLNSHYGRKIKSFCNYKDYYCASGALAVNAVTVGNYSKFTYNYSYLMLTVDLVVEFLVCKTRG